MQDLRTKDERNLSRDAYRGGLRARMDECAETLRTGTTGDPDRPYFSVTALEAIIDCHRRIIREMDEDDARDARR